MQLTTYLSKDRGNTLDKVIEGIIDTDQDVDLPVLKSSIYAYILHQLNYNAFRQNALRSGLTITQSKLIRQKIVSLFESNLELKQNTLLAYFGNFSPKKIQNLTSKSQNDDEFLIRNVEKFSFFNGRKIGKEIKESPVKSPRAVERDCERLLIDLSPFMRKLAYRKMKFVSNSNNFPVLDIVSDLGQKAVETYYRITPFYDGLHRENFVKRAIHNEGMRIIQVNTTQKRKRLIREDDGSFQNVIASVSEEISSYLSEFTDPRWFEEYQEVELKLAFDRYKKTKCNALTATVVDHILGWAIPNDFSTFLEKTSKSSMREGDAADHPKMFVKMLADFYEIPPITVKLIAWDLRLILTQAKH